MDGEWQVATTEKLAALRDAYSGQRGDGEAEAVVHWSRWDTETVRYYSTRGADIARAIDRFGLAITRFATLEGGAELEVSLVLPDGRRVFRGLEYAFTGVGFDEARPKQELRGFLKGGDDDQE